MSIMTLHQLERISGMVSDVIAKAPPKHPTTRRLCLKLAALDQVIAERKSHKGETV
jgi:hypothetical protein